MTRILVVWEDEYFQTLAGLVKRRVSALKPNDAQKFADVLHHTVYGQGSFERYVRSTWKMARVRGTPKSPGAIDHLICVVDGDLRNPPADSAEVSAWHADAEVKWRAELHAACDPSVPHTSVHGVVLRWAKESLLLAGYDCAPVRDRLKLELERAELDAFLKACDPSPSTIAATDFTNTFRKPLRCVNKMRKAIAEEEIKKNAIVIDDVLKLLAFDHHASIAERVPDLDRLAQLVWVLT